LDLQVAGLVEEVEELKKVIEELKEGNDSTATKKKKKDPNARE
jgi:hypothetical protein